MGNCQIHSCHNSINSKITTQKKEEIFQQSKRRSKFLIWNSQGAKSCKRHHHDYNRTDKIGFHSRRTHNQPAYNSHGISQCTGNPHSSFPNQFKRQFQDHQLRNTGKGYALSCLGKGQKHVRGKNLRVKPDHCKIKSRQQCSSCQCT